MIKRFKKDRLAIFDVDGTLFNGNMGIEFLKALMEKGIVSKEISDSILSWYKKYKNDEVDKAVAVDEIYMLFAKGMSGKREAEMKLVAEETWDNVSNKLYPYVRGFVKDLQAEGLRIVLLSGSPIEMVRILGMELKIGKRETIAGRLEVKDGVYTGRIIYYPGSSKEKLRAIDSYLEKSHLNIDFPHSAGMGDNERDMRVLKKVGKPFVFEPKSVFKAQAKREKFTIVNRNNVVSNVLRAVR